MEVNILFYLLHTS